MTRNVVTTELVSDKPVVVVLHFDQFLAEQLIDRLKQQPITVESYSVSEFLQSEHIQKRADQAYKILLILDCQSFISAEAQLSTTCQALIPFQNKTSISFPVITPFVEQVPGEIPYASRLFATQQEAILFLNSYLPAANFLFGQDVIHPQIGISCLSLITQDITRGKLYTPHIHFHPQTVPSYVERTIRYFLQPKRASVLIRGASASGESLAGEIKKLYQAYHFVPVELQEVLAHTESPIPFSVVENFVTENITQAITETIQALPTPSAQPKQSVWEQMFGSLASLSQNLSLLGTEVDPELISQSAMISVEDLPQDTEVTSLQDTTFTSLLDQDLPTVQKARPRLGGSSGVQSPILETPANVLPEDQSPSTETQLPKKEFNLNQEIQELFSETHVKHKKTQTKRIEKKTIGIQKKSKKRTAVFYGGLAFTGMGLGIVCLAIFFVVNVRMLTSSLSEYVAQKANAQELQMNSAQKLERIERLSALLRIQSETYSTVLELPALEEADRLATIGTSLPVVNTHLAETDRLAGLLYAQTMGLDPGDPVVTAAHLADTAVVAYESLSSLYDELDTATVPLSQTPELETAINTYGTDLTQRKNSIQVIQQLSPLLGNWLGVSEKRTYAVVLQNNQELRPTGGFIESVALLTFDHGSLISSRVFSGYSVDKQMSGTVESPAEVQHYLNEDGFNFVDSNWSPHFPDSAGQITWFLDKSMGVTVDGVIALDLDGMAKILEATGPLDLPKYNEVLTHKNLQDLFEFHSEISLVDTSEDYRTEVFDAFIKKMTALPPEKAPALFNALRENFSAQHLLASFTNADELNTMTALGWSGSLLKPGCPSQLQNNQCVVDTVAQVEANVGINKANFLLERSIDHQVSLTATEAAHTRKITFQNTAQTDSWPKGSYKVFTRLYVPAEALFKSITVDGTSISPVDVTEKIENGRKVIGFYLEVPVKTTRVAEVQYSVPYSLTGTEFSYAFFEQQQAGSGFTPFTLVVTPAPEFRPTLIAPQAEFKNNAVTFSKSTIGHQFFGIKFN